MMSTRSSLEGIPNVTKDYYKNLPEELVPFNYYFDDMETGHVIMAIPKCFLDEALRDGNMDDYECPFPVKWVLEKGYEIINSHVVCDGAYDDCLGLVIDEQYYEVE